MLRERERERERFFTASRGGHLIIDLNFYYLKKCVK